MPFVRDSWGIRRLSVQEVALLQGFDTVESLFPDIPAPEKYRLLGNAVCVHLAQQVGQSCANILDGGSSMTTVNGEFGWRFPPTNGGRVDGFNDPGIAHFSGFPYSSLARETIQNSLDARDSYDEPVHVSFEMIELSPDELGQAELSAAIEACGNEVDSDDPAQSELIRAQEVLALNEVPFLRVSDRNTTGLRGKHWRTLVKMQGASFKADLEGAGGSFGIGKYAPIRRLGVAHGLLLDLLRGRRV